MTTLPATFELPTTDRLTSLLTMTYFRHVLREEAFSNAEQRDEPITVCLVDLDNFMALNQTYGHAFGDEVLRRIADVFQRVLPETALVARYSGDELAAALSDTRLDDAFSLLEDFRRQIADMSFPDKPGFKLSCSIGLACYPTHARSDVELLRQADEALYMAKSTGRNKVALPLSDSRMITKTSYYTATQLTRLAELSKLLKRNEATVLREALDDVLRKYDDRLERQGNQAA